MRRRSVRSSPAILALGILAAAAAVPRFVDTIEPLKALFVVPAAVVLALVSIALARRARLDFQLTLGRTAVTASP